jgi:hypothetical protein
MRRSRILAVAVSIGVLGTLAAAPALAKGRDVERLGESVARDWVTWNPGGAPVSSAFVQAALRQGLTVDEVELILESQALAGPRTSGTFSSPELLGHFTASPDLIPALLSAVRSVQGAPHSYLEYLTGGGTPGAAYRSYDQLLQEEVLAIAGARDAYLSGVSTVPALERMAAMREGQTTGQGQEDGAGLLP